MPNLQSKNKKEEKVKRPAHRPEKPIDWDNFEKLCAMQCTQGEMASFFDMCADQFKIRVEKQYNPLSYQETYKRFSDRGKCSLRRTQIKLSQRNSTMAIWLGKNWLGQKDTPSELTISEDTVQHFDALMNQIGKVQSDKSSLNMDESSINKEM